MLGIQWLPGVVGWPRFRWDADGLLPGMLTFFSNGTELGERLDPRRRRGPRLDADAVVDLQGPQADAPAPRRRSLLDRLEALRGARRRQLLPRELLLPRLSPRVRVRVRVRVRAAASAAASLRRG